MKNNVNGKSSNKFGDTDDHESKGDEAASSALSNLSFDSKSAPKRGLIRDLAKRKRF